MEEAIVRLLGVAIKEATSKWDTAEELVDRILTNGHVAMRDWSRQDLIDYIKTLN